MKINIKKVSANIFSKYNFTKVLTFLMIFNLIIMILPVEVNAETDLYYNSRTGKGYVEVWIYRSSNISSDSIYLDFSIDDRYDDAPYGIYRITTIDVAMDSAYHLHDREVRTPWGVYDLRASKGFEESNYSDTVFVNKTATLADSWDSLSFELKSYRNRTSVACYGYWVEMRVNFELVQEIKKNTPPVVSIIQPSNGQSFEKYQKPTIKYNVYDVDGDTMTGITSVYANGRSQTINTKTGIRNGNTVTVDMSDSVWKSLPSNVNLIFSVDLSDGQEIATRSITIMKLNNPPSVLITEPTKSLSLRTDQPPTVKARVSDSDTGDVLNATLQYLSSGTWKNAVTNSNLASGEITSLVMSKSTWETVSFNTPFQLRVKVNDGDSDSYSGTVQVTRINTAPNIAILKPVENEKMFWGYLPFTWQINDIDNDNISLKIWTDTPNIVDRGILYNGSIGKNPYTNNYLSRAYLPLGKHNIFFEFRDGYHTIEKKVTIEIEDIANIHINDNDTFYIPIFSKEKSDIYYRRINNELDAKKYIFNILELPINQNYISNIQGIENVTGKSNYINNGNRIFTTDGIFDVKKTADWIYSKVNSAENPLIKVTETGNTITLKNIEFTDEEKDYITTEPVPRGKDRQFKFEHYPQVYENADSEITKNGEWLRDDSFNIFDKNEVIRNGEDITITLSKSGKYIVSAKEKDNIFNPAGIDFSKESNPKYIELYAHRRPFAKIAWTDNMNDTIKLESKSYDLDFETRADKGIQEEIWQYRFVGYDDIIIQDWQSITNLNNFKPDIKYKTDIKLTVKDYGARLDLVNDGELTATDIVTIDATGKPPVADFEYKVGTTLLNSVMADGEIYKGNAGNETLHLDDSYTIWNDFFGRATTRLVTWSKTQGQLNSEIPSSNSLITKLTVRNKYNLTDSITKSVEVKDIKINDDSKLVNNNKNFNFNVNINLSSLKYVDKWGNFLVQVTSNDFETTSFELENIFSNKFQKSNVKVIDRDNDNTLRYIVSVYSKRTGELISKENYTLTLNRPPTASISVIPNKIYEGDSVNVKVKGTDPDLDKLTLEVRHRVNHGTWKTIWSKDNVDSGEEQIFNINKVVAGNHELQVTATDPHGATGTASTSFMYYL